MTRLSIAVLFVCTAIAPVSSQTASDLYLFDLDINSDAIHVHNARFLNGFNKGGYNNQPWFNPTGELLLTVKLKDDDQTDIYELALDKRSYRKLTNTTTSEFSPRLDPSEDHLTFVQQKSADPIDQEVCRVNRKTHEFENITINMKDVGYYSWLSDTELGLFRVDDTVHKLSYYNTKDFKSRRITSSIGRTLLTDDEGKLVYVHKFDDEYWYIKKYQPSTSSIEIVTQTIGRNEDFAIGPDGSYYMGDKSKLYFFRPEKDKTWQLLADLSAYNIHHITRLAISPDGKKIVVVSDLEKTL